MSFTFEARTLLELGKELISTDEVALFELIKNAVDAGSSKVEIDVRSSLPYTDYREAVRQLRESSRALSEVTAFIRGKMEVDESGWCEECLAELDWTTHRDTYRERLDAHYARLNSIEIRDTGEGMSFEDLSDVYLRIGTRHRRRQNEEGATKLGDKGIGRLSAMRLGDLLTVETSKKGERHWNVLNIDWGVFSHSEDMVVQDIESCSRAEVEESGNGTSTAPRYESGA